MNELEQTKIAITVMATAQIMHEALDELQDTPFYKGTLKHLSKKLEQQLTLVCDHHIAKLWELDEEIIQSIQSGIDEVCKELATMDPAKIIMLGQFLKSKNLNFEE